MRVRLLRYDAAGMIDGNGNIVLQYTDRKSDYYYVLFSFSKSPAINRRDELIQHYSAFR